MSLEAKDFHERGKPRPARDTPINRRWWEMAPNDAADSVTSVLDILREQQQRRVAQHVDAAKLYGNLPILGLAGMSSDKLAASRAALKDRVTFNVIQSVIDTAQSKMAKNKPRPLFLTSGGNYQAQRKAKKLNKFCDGVFYETKAHEEGIEVFRDGEVFGDGFTHVFERADRVCHERVLSSELWIDEVEAFYGRPRSMHRVKDVDRDVLLAAFPKAKAAIIDAQQSTNEDKGRRSNILADMVTVRESWHLPSGPGAKDGKRIVTIDGHALTPLLDWTHDFFPFARFRWCPRLWGYWSQGIAEQLQNIQVEINKLLWVIQRSFHLGGSYKVFLEMGSKIVKEGINNEIGGIVYYRGTAPQYVVPPLVAPEIYQQLMQLKQSAYEQAGVSTMNATSTKPAGLNSGKAIREFDDIGADRQLTPGQRYQGYYLQLARLDIATAKDIAQRNGGKYAVTVPGKRFLSTVDWREIDLEEDEYVMQCFPISSLPTDPEGRLQTVQEYAQAGYITPRQAKRLLEFPDIEQVESLSNAAEEYLQMVLDKIVDEGEFTPPEPSDDLQLAMELVLEYYQLAKAHGLDEERLELLRTFRAQVEVLISQATPPAPAAQSVPGGTGTGPQATPAPPPVSDLLPNAPQMAA